MFLHRTACIAAAFAALNMLASGCLILNSGGNANRSAASVSSQGRWRSTTVSADAPGLPDAVCDSFSAPETTGGRSYVVQKGDSLSTIARRYYGDTTRWKSIYEANRHAIADPNSLEPGITLRIP